ncbi:hypothetical protein PCANC_18769 [Puccinia coronata f. sp. avenae]|uniref:TRP C-terminal domain-containing protein n=1 Tax=Puccinia coronata f. sp. avenae TaxID=200324 RepID=A0A2N5UEG9_9BASI|nr:hypothetical protein PCASD_20298 [Puccinia coronata f. sp. avenae]PLW36096.1 hypothetical protein PCANC_18769 [Puccinia coronata f. sp. avenae]
MRHSQAITPSIHKFLPTSGYGRTFLLITLLESGIDIVLEAIVIARLKLIPSLKLPSNPGDFSPARSPLAVYLAIFIAAHLFQLYFAVDALRHKNTIQLIGLCCFNFAFLVYAIIQVPEIREIETLQTAANTSTTPAIILLIIPVCIGISQIAFMYLTWYLFKEFGWQIYKQIGADRRIKRVYLWYQIFMCLLKFDYFFFMAFSVQLVLLVPSVSPLERVLTVIALPTTLLLLLIGYYGVRREIKAVTYLFMLGLLSGSSYFIYKLFRIWQGRLDPSSYENVFKSLTVFSVSCLLMTLLSFTSATICLVNFGKGLKPQIDKNSSHTQKKNARRRMGGEEDSDSGIDELGRRRYERRGSLTSVGTGGTIPCKLGMEEMSGESAGMEPQSLSTFKSNNDPRLDLHHDHELPATAAYFQANLDFHARPHPPPFSNDTHNNPAFEPLPPPPPPHLSAPTPKPRASNRAHNALPRPRLDDTHKRMSID